MEKFYIKIRITDGTVMGEDLKVDLPIAKAQINEIATEHGWKKHGIHFESNLPEEIQNFIKYQCVVNYKENSDSFSVGNEVSFDDIMKTYNKIAMCVQDLYLSDDYPEEYITRFLQAYSECGGVLISKDFYDLSFLGGCIPKTDEAVAFIVEATANFKSENISFWDYSQCDGNVLSVAAFDIDGYENEYLEDYDDDPCEYIESLTGAYDLFVDEDEEYMLDLHHKKIAETAKYDNELESRLAKMGY